ncbi:MAG: hydrogen peroxide-inducible genes activator [Prolixibacteraceae bacterium]|jgi:LysR family hydrogen peroxide-inducible transcriptional activator|nr:hydrogen peroxide-inducible genes activator [Prolixibacteraceae bacterium]NLX29817.1 hydrogen peroxide-inducible genes activator [Bacteroidales bacterium]HPJ77879.1 hydrogen peroxide-inducible genes activator [Prolixibacteraceae bacterium]HRV88580.1 hydrogen peroxide-inducible genes activator [Prolixibacteraceae bacterium]
MITLTQLEYIVAVDTYRHFGKAAEQCFVTQPTLSMQIRKLEEDLEVILFDRSKQPLIPTDVGQRIVEQARVVLTQAEELKNIIRDHKNQVSGVLRIGIIPTLAPYLLPLFIGRYKRAYPNILIRVEELTTRRIIDLLHKDLLDVGLLVTPLREEKIIEKPVFYEEMLIYAHPEHPLHAKKEISPADIATPDIWLLSDGHCFRNQVVNLCSYMSGAGGELPFQFEAGSLETIMNIVDKEGGLTLIPELARLDMNPDRRKNILSFTTLKPLREVSLVYSRHFAKHRLINLLWKEVREAVPPGMTGAGRGSVVEWK